MPSFLNKYGFGQINYGRQVGSNVTVKPLVVAYDSESGLKMPIETITMGIYDKPYILCYFPINVMTSGGNIIGGVLPDNDVVNISYCSHDNINLQNLQDGLIASVASENGSFGYSASSFDFEEIVLWTIHYDGITMSFKAELDAHYIANLNIDGFVSTIVYAPVGEILDGEGIEHYPAITLSVSGPADGTNVIVSKLENLSTETCPVCNGSSYDENGNECSVCNASGFVPIIPEITADDLTETLQWCDMQDGVGTIVFDGTYTDIYAAHTHIYIVWYEGNTGSLNVEMTYTDEEVCLSGDTEIMLADGTTKRLDSLDGTELLMSKDGEPTKIVARKRGSFSSYSKFYTFSDGSKIHETHPHRFYNVDQGFYQWLPKWKIGDRAQRYDGKLVSLISVEDKPEHIQMFGLWTESHTYYANGLLSGTAEANIPLLENADTSVAIKIAQSLTDAQMTTFMEDGGLLP